MRPDTESLLESHRLEITRYCQRMLGSASDAEDAAQETLVRAWRGLDRFQGRSSMRSWLYRIATNVCLDTYRSRGRRAVPVEVAPDAIPVAAGGHTSPDPAELAVVQEAVRHALVVSLVHLSHRQRTVLILREALRWRAAEVADALGISVAAVNSALQRARASLAANPAMRQQLRSAAAR